MWGGAFITASTRSPWGVLARCSTRLSSSPRDNSWRLEVEIEVRLEIVRDGLLKDCRMLSTLRLGMLDVDDDRSNNPDDVLDLNLALLRTSRVSDLSGTLALPSLLFVSLESTSKDRSCKS